MEKLGKGGKKLRKKLEKNMSFFNKDNDVLGKYNEIWDKIKETLSIKIHSMPIYDGKYIKAEVRELSSVLKTKFLSDEVQKKTNITLALPV